MPRDSCEQTCSDSSTRKGESRCKVGLERKWIDREVHKLGDEVEVAKGGSERAS